jgi:hypothetical protein
MSKRLSLSRAGAAAQPGRWAAQPRGSSHRELRQQPREGSGLDPGGPAYWHSRWARNGSVRIRFPEVRSSRQRVRKEDARALGRGRIGAAPVPARLHPASCNQLGRRGALTAVAWKMLAEAGPASRWARVRCRVLCGRELARTSLRLRRSDSLAPWCRGCLSKSSDPPRIRVYRCLACAASRGARAFSDST